MLSVEITDPINNTVFTGPTNIILTATASSTNPISNVAFYFGTNFIGQVTPTVTAYGPIAGGNVALTNSSPLVIGSSTTFLADFAVGDYVVFTGQPSMTYQVLSVATNTQMILSTSFTGTTISSDTVRTVTLFGYFNFAWNNVQIGNYTITAVVTDNLGSTLTSTPVMITVIAQTSPAPTAPITGSSIGFGHNPFGGSEFGYGDWAEEMLWKNIPEFYRIDDASGPPGSLVQKPLRNFINAIKPFFQELRDKWGKFTTLWDAGRVPLSNLPQLAYNVGITVDPTKSEGLQRSSVLNASQLWINKGTDKGYQITAAFEGLLVDITPLWGSTCAEANQTLGITGPAPTSFDLSTTAITEHPVVPGTLDITVTTAQKLQQSITDDTFGNLVGRGNVPNGKLSKIFVTGAITVNLTSLVTGINGPFTLNDFVVQQIPGTANVTNSDPNVTGVGTTFLTTVAPGQTIRFANQPLVTYTVLNVLTNTSLTLTTNFTGPTSATRLWRAGGTVVSTVGFTIKVNSSFGAFVASFASNDFIDQTRPGTTGTIGSVAIDSLTIGETALGLTSNTLAIVRDNATSTNPPVNPVRFLLIDTVTTNAGFAIGESLVGQTSGSYMIAGATVPLVQGPLRETLTFAIPITLSGITGSFNVGDTVIRGAGATGVIVAVAGPVIQVYVTSGAFTAGTITNITAPLGGSATAAIGAPVTGAFTVGALVSGSLSGATGVVKSVSPAAIQVEVITTPGFSTADVLTQAPATSAVVGHRTYGKINYLTGEMTGTTWSLAAGSTVDSVVDFSTSGPTQFLPQLDLAPADLVPLDYIQTDKYALWPRYLTPVRVINGILTPAKCRSYSLRLFFYKPDDTEIENFIDVATRILSSIENFRPIHVRLDKISFDGARASSQLWRTDRVVADSFAVSTWSVSVSATQFASSQRWSMSTMSATVAT